MRRGRLAGMAVLAALTGCGGDDSEPERPKTVTKAEYLQRADAICTDATRKLKPVFKREPAKFFSDIRRNANRRAEIEEEKLRRLRALPPPDADRRLLSRYLRKLEAQIAQVRKLEGLAAAEDRKRLLAEEKKYQRAAGAEVRSSQAFGFGVCGIEASQP